MIYKKSNEVFEYEGKKYKVGDRIVANEISDEYEGLIGYITEIRDGDDKDTENVTPDIYCSFFDPVMPYDVAQIESRFSDSYGEPKTLEDIILDEVIMAPEMIVVISNPQVCKESEKVYIVSDDWSGYGSSDSETETFVDLVLAKAYMREQVRKTFQEGELLNWREDSDCIEESSELVYEIYIAGWYDQKHYSIRIDCKSLNGK